MTLGSPNANRSIVRSVIAGYAALSGFDSTERRQLKRGCHEKVEGIAHGGEAAANAERAAQVLFGELDVREAPRTVFEMLGGEIPTSAITTDGVALVDAVVSSGLATSKSEARRLIEQGAVSVNGEKISDVARKLSATDWPKGYVLLRKGKKDYALLRAG